MENKLSVWIISDDASLFSLHRAMQICASDVKTCEHVNKHVEVKIVGSSLRTCMSLYGSPDIIILDMSCVTLLNAHDTHYDLLKAFARKHTSSIICLVSMCMPLANEAFQELKNTISDEVVVEKWENGMGKLAQYITSKVLMYYPLEGKK